MSTGTVPTAAGSLAASYAARAHREQERLNESGDKGQLQEREFPVVLPTLAGVPHSTLNLTHGIVVDPAAKKLAKFENEKYLRSHPELGVMIQDFVVHILQTRPTSIETAAIEFFVREGGKRSGTETSGQTS